MYSVLPSHSLLSPSAIKVNGSLSAIRPTLGLQQNTFLNFLQKATVVVKLTFFKNVFELILVYCRYTDVFSTLKVLINFEQNLCLFWF
jgi:hypothetical protein